MPAQPARRTRPDAERNRTDWTPWLTAAGLALVCAAVYSNSFGAGFPLDNRQLILRDPRVHALSSENLRLIFQHSYWWPYGESGLYRPLSPLSYLFNYAVLGNAERPAGYHLVNLVLHICNVLLLWRITLRLTASSWTAIASAALWATMPLSTEAVTNIVGRADLMAASGSLAAVLIYLRWRDDEARGAAGWRGPAAALAIATFVILGTLAKESALAVVGVIAVVEFIWWNGTAGLRRLAWLAAAGALPVGWWLWQRGLVLGAAVPPEFPFTDNPIGGAPF